MRLLRERLSDFRESNLQTVQEWTKSDIELITLYVHPKNSNLRSHLRAIMALDLSRLDLENKSGRTFCVRQVYFTKSCKQVWGRVNQPFIHFIHHIWGETVPWGAFFYHTDLGQNAVFHNFAIQIAPTLYSGRSKHVWAFSETVKKKSKINYTASRFSLLTSVKVDCLNYH